METAIKIMILLHLAITASCTKWDPNLQYSYEMSAKEKLLSKLQQKSTSDRSVHLKLGQSFSEVISIIGNDYRILARLKDKETHWLRIEFLNNSNRLTSSDGRTELLFKNNLLIKIQ